MNYSIMAILIQACWNVSWCVFGFCKSLHEKVKSCNLNPGILQIAPGINFGTKYSYFISDLALGCLHSKEVKFL
jgi:hypothetical protein